MAFIFKTNVFLERGWTLMAVFTLKEHLKLAGWTVPISSDGLTYNPSGDQITTYGGGANGLDNDNAWFVIRAPDNLHEWMFKRGVFLQDPIPAGNSQYRFIAVSKTAGFVAGATPATDTPTAPDIGWVATDTFYNFNIGGSARDMRWNICAETTAPYRFWAGPMDGSNGNYGTAQIIAMDTINASTIAGQIDPDPYIYVVTADEFLFGWAYSGTVTDQVFTNFNGLYFNDDWNGGVVPGGGGGGYGSNKHNNKDDLAPLLWGTTYDRGQGIKGLSSLFRLVGNKRTIGTVLTLNTPADLIILGPDINNSGAYIIAAPWNGTLPKRDIP